MPEWPNWVWWTIGGMLGASGLALLLWALFADRARGGRRCPKCWYDMSGSPAPGLTCSECGYQASRERTLFKTRRRWRIAFISLLLGMATPALRAYDEARRDGWGSQIPSTALILAADWFGSSLALDALDQRLSQDACYAPPLNYGRLDDWQWRWLSTVCCDCLKHGVSRQARYRALNLLWNMQWFKDLDFDRERVVDALHTSLHDSDDEVRGLSAYVLTLYRETDQTYESIVPMLQDRSPVVRGWTLGGVSWLARPDRMQVLMLERAILDDVDPQSKERAEKGMEELRGRARVRYEKILQALSDPEEDVQARAVEAASDMMFDNFFKDEVRRRLIVIARGARNCRLRADAVRTLGYGGGFDQASFELACEMLIDKTPEVRRSAVESILLMDADPAVTMPAFLKALEDESPQVRNELCNELYRSDFVKRLRPFADQIEQLARSQHDEIASAARHALKEFAELDTAGER